MVALLLSTNPIKQPKIVSSSEVRDFRYSLPDSPGPLQLKRVAMEGDRRVILRDFSV